MTAPDRNNASQSISRRVLASLCLIGFLLVLTLVVMEHTSGFDDPIRQAFYSLRTERLTQVLVVLTNAANKYVIIALCLILLAIPQTRLPFGVPLSAGALATIMLNSGIKHLVMRPRPEALHLVVEDGYSFPSGHSVTSMFFYGMALWLVWHYVSPSGFGASTDSAASSDPKAGSESDPKAGLEAGTNSGLEADANARLEADANARLEADANARLEADAMTSKSLLRYEKRTAIALTVLLLIPMIFVGLTRIYLGVHFPTDVLGAWCLAGFLIFTEAEIIVALEQRHEKSSVSSS